ncbi:MULTISPECIES: YqeG family HAD IIIA-type phosphatase [Exiguobacterium]|uniref:YqeG family HAD IIIA-type phosphatase n=1 Tax=Exiguobacterium TaxID=33986 RepID=UPI000478AEB0|nr:MULTISPECIES: YqeG family HAD IIIA-type phosphatase [Exiguobacterium]MCK2158071.1 YqeG family HAD IIIA-type phosphatase [Exiguobacterium sp. 17-1]MCT4793213.1 YqeG family HAD IIIA-type phosphatase [Exiguobacterium artemiae]MDW2886291.1 YqeG family HAD IIIA-type phosphatase [Exiguobacterium sibiricum]MDX1259757.1 YqeG family HAD IIIA-type phosphatase [Exiguobacterium sp. K1]RDB34848.1 YqeG family HAD IIIA-type phosphatase [Exiguobacterium sp. RIT594]
MFKRLYPKHFVASIYDIDLEMLKRNGVKAILTDLDNTLVAWNIADAPDELVSWLDMVNNQYGFDVIIVSNNNGDRVKKFADPLGLHYIAPARKPLPIGFKRALTEFGYHAKEVVFLGDQLFTDVLGANSVGIEVIHVQPVVKTDGVVTKFNRLMERLIFRRMKRKGIYKLTQRVKEDPAALKHPIETLRQDKQQ